MTLFRYLLDGGSVHLPRERCQKCGEAAHFNGVSSTGGAGPDGELPTIDYTDWKCPDCGHLFSVEWRRKGP